MALLGGPLAQLNLVTLEPAVEETANDTVTLPWLRRSRDMSVIPEPKDPLSIEKTAQDSVDITMGFDASLRARHLGIVIHQYLEWMAQEGTSVWNASRLDKESPTIERLLLREGMSPVDVAGAVEKVLSALNFVLQDDRGRWVLCPHEDARSEWALSYLSEQGQIQNIVIDRSFIDEDGTRWIIDYKTGTHQGGDLQSYLQVQKEKYRGQLEKYATILHTMESRPIKLGLYFPFADGFCQWDWSTTSFLIKPQASKFPIRVVDVR